MIQKALVNVEISYNECIGPSCILRETRVIRPGILVVRDGYDEKSFFCCSEKHSYHVHCPPGAGSWCTYQLNLVNNTKLHNLARAFRQNPLNLYNRFSQICLMITYSASVFTVRPKIKMK